MSKDTPGTLRIGRYEVEPLAQGPYKGAPPWPVPGACSEATHIILKHQPPERRNNAERKAWKPRVWRGSVPTLSDLSLSGPWFPHL